MFIFGENEYKVDIKIRLKDHKNVEITRERLLRGNCLFYRIQDDHVSMVALYTTQHYSSSSLWITTPSWRLRDFCVLEIISK